MVFKDTELGKRMEQGAIMLRISGSMGREYSYDLIEGMSQRELYRNIAQFHDESGDYGNLEKFLAEQGAKVTPWYDSNDFTEEYPVHFYDLEYDFDNGITEASELLCTRQAELMINQAEYGETFFNSDDRNLIVNYAYKLGNMEDTRKLINEMIDAIERPDLRSVMYVKERAQIEIDALPDTMVGITEMNEYGYRNKTVLPLTKERALYLYAYEKDIRILESDGSSKTAESREDIQNHNGLFGIRKTAWERLSSMPEQEDIETEYTTEPMHPLNQEQAMEVYDLGYPVYYPMEGRHLSQVRMRTEIEENNYFQMGLSDWEQAQERLITEGSVSRFGIYQLKDTQQADAYRFMSMDFVERQGLHVDKEDYNLVYSGLLRNEDSLDSLYERFNVRRPGDFTGHSLSVSDVVVLQRDGVVTANYVDSFGYQELENFVSLELPIRLQLQNLEVAAIHIADRYLTIQEVTDGYDYNIYDEQYHLLDGGVYDNPDISLWQATKEIIMDLQEPVQNHTTGELVRRDTQGNVHHGDWGQLVDYEKITELAEEANRIPEALTMTSKKRESDSLLNGESQSEIEETVLALAQAELIERDSDVTLLAARVYGSRTRHLLTRPESDLDVVLYYQGNIREDDFFHSLNQYGMTIAGMKLDINPICAEQTGTLESFLKRNDQYLDEKEKELQKNQDYKPLAKVEELEEANYNMIDNIINNEKPKAKLDYYVAECDEFHSMGEYQEGLTLQEAVKEYEKLLDDPRRSYMGNAMGFVLHDPENEIYSEMAYPIVQGKSVHGDNINEIQEFSKHPLVREAVELIRQAFPDYPYYPPEDLAESMYPHFMGAEALAIALDQFAEEFDPYEYRDQIQDEEDQIHSLKMDIMFGNTKEIMAYLKDIINDENEFSAQAQVLLERLKESQTRISPDMEPAVKILYSEHDAFHKDAFYSMDEMNRKVKALDHAIAEGTEKANEGQELTYRIQYQIYYYQDSQMQKYNGTVDVGEGCGSLLQSIDARIDVEMNDEGWMKYQESLREAGGSSYQQDLVNMQEKVLPYLQSFCSIDERSPEKTVNNVGNNEQEKAGKQKVVKATEEKKLSIHERLEINKEKLGKKLEKDEEMKGLEIV